jgi:DNA-binding MarR family transcriptional regulator
VSRAAGSARRKPRENEEEGAEVRVGAKGADAKGAGVRVGAKGADAKASGAGVRSASAKGGNAEVASAVDGRGVRAIEFGPLADYIGYALRRAQMASVTEFLDAMKPVDLRPTQFAVLILINENPGVRQTEVCAALGLQKANFVPLLNELQRRGLAVRKAGAPDRRASALHLTAQGEALLKKANELHSAWEASVEARLGANGREQLLVLLRQLL